MEPHRVDYSNEVPEGENVINKRREGLSEFQKNILSSGYSLQDIGIKRRKEEINDEFLSDSEKEKEKERSDSEKGTSDSEEETTYSEEETTYSEKGTSDSEEETSDSEEETTYSEEIDQALVDELIKKRIAKKEEEVLQTFKEIRYSWEVFWGSETPGCDCESCNLHKYPYKGRSFVPRPWVN